MKKILSILLAAALIVCTFAACGNKKADTSSDLAYVKDKGTLVIGITLLLLWIIMKRVIPQTLRALRLILQELFAKNSVLRHFPGNKLGGKRERAKFKKC